MAGTPAPYFSAPSPVNPSFAFSSLGGHYVLLAFLPLPGPERERALELVRAQQAAFTGPGRLVFGVLPDEASFRSARNTEWLRWFGDWTGEIRRLYGAADADGEVVPQWIAIDPSLRILGAAPLDQGPRVITGFIGRGSPENHAGVPLHAPVLTVPRILEPDLCRQLIERYHADGGQPSGVMRQVDGRTVPVMSDFKKRRDAQIAENDPIREVLNARIGRRLAPEIEKAFRYRATRIERYIVACYDAAEGGFFQPHRDNTTTGTAHRDFAVSINLNADFEGGDLRFPEFGMRTYRPPVGGAVVFSCSLLHEATPVTSGTRYAFLPFLYNEAQAAVRAANLHTIQRTLGEEEDREARTRDLA